MMWKAVFIHKRIGKWRCRWRFGRLGVDRAMRLDSQLIFDRDERNGEARSEENSYFSGKCFLVAVAKGHVLSREKGKAELRVFPI
jgi:hypothetical protein